MTSGSGEDEFLLKWHDHHQSFFLLVEEMVLRDQLTDVTLACVGAEDQTDLQLIPAHSLMLSVCSPYFRTLLSENRHREKHHIIHLHGVSARHMQQLLVYMYRGEISISQEDLAPLIETARCLQIKGLAMAQPNVNIAASPNPKKRSLSHTSPSSEHVSSPPSGSKSKKIKVKSQQQQNSEELAVVNTSRDSDPEEKYDETNIGETKDNIDLPEAFYSPKSNNQLPLVALPLLPKPLTVLKTAETRTYLSKLIWIGNGGKRPQYGNPETKPGWWPQHILPWEEMKKMGGRKSVELSHINYTEVLKQCLAAGYEYFGYDPSTYYSTDQQDCSYIIDDGHSAADDDATSSNGEKHDQPLEIDLDDKTDVKSEAEHKHNILCK